MPPKTPRFLPPRDHDTDLPRSTPRFRAPPSSIPSTAPRRPAPSFFTPSQAIPSASQQNPSHAHSVPPRFVSAAPLPPSSVTPARRDRAKFTSTPGIHFPPDDLDEDDADNDSETPIKKKIRISAANYEDTEDEDLPAVRIAAVGSGIDTVSSPASSGEEKWTKIKRAESGVDIESDEESISPVRDQAGARKVPTVGDDGNNVDGGEVATPVLRSRTKVDINKTPSRPSSSSSQYSSLSAPKGSQDDEDSFPTPSRPSRFTQFIIPNAENIEDAPPPQRSSLLSRLRAASPMGASISRHQMLLMTPEKKRSTYVPGGLASTVSGWIVDSRNAFENRQRRHDVMRVRVTEIFGRVIKGLRKVRGLDEQEATGDETALLIGDVEVELGDIVLIRWPWIDIDMPTRGRIRVAVFWNVERNEQEINEQQQQEDMDHALLREEHQHDSETEYQTEMNFNSESNRHEDCEQTLEEVLGFTPSPVFPA